MLKPTASPVADQIINGLTSGVIAVDAHGAILAANPAASKHLSLPQGTLRPGVLVGEIEPMDPLVQMIRHVAETQHPLARQEVMFRPNPNELRELGVSIALLEGPDHYNGAILLFTDMTERRRLERTASVNRQLASIGELAAGMVHQLRNPLTIVAGRAQMLARSIKDDAKGQESLDAVRDECHRMSESISQFLAFAKPFEMKPAEAAARTIVDRAFELNRADAEAAGIELLAEIPTHIQPMWVDQLRLSEALSNIIDNAIDAVGSKGTVKVVVSQDTRQTSFEVRDTGPGIQVLPGEDLLSPFLTKKHDGTGLGLSVVQRIVSAQHGTVTYGNRDPERGAWFRITVPTAQRASFED